MSAPASPKSRADAKVRRQKQIVAVGSVILLVLLGFEVPKLLGGGSAQTAPTPISTTSGSPGSPLAAAPGKLPNTDRVVIERQVGQLLSFGLFRSKDPFVQQLSVNAVTLPVVPTSQPRKPSGPPAVTTAGGSTTPATTVPLPVTTPGVPGAATPSATPPAASATAPTSVLITTNGACENVTLNGTFPGGEDIFRIVSIARDGKSVEIAVVGGAYDNGKAVATLKLGETLTLVNTADGTRYVISLRSRCDVQVHPATTPTTSAPAIATPATTTPIVTDSLDTTTPTG